MRSHPNPFTRYESCNQAINWRGIRGTDFWDVALNEKEYPEIRGMALQAVGDYLQNKNRSLGWVRRGLKTMEKFLDHPSVELRFWASFELGACGAKSAIPRLQELAATDHRRLHGWWTVAEEAQDALLKLSGGWPDDRDCYQESQPQVFSWQRV